MTILAITNVHERPKLIYEQLENYNHCFDGDIVHGVNVNADFAESFEQSRVQSKVDFDRLGNVFFNPSPVRTKRFAIAQAYFAVVLEAMRRNIRFDYVLFHTAADLMVRPMANRYVRRFDVGVGHSGGTVFRGEADALDFGGVEQAWRAQVAADSRLHQLAMRLGSERLYKSRQEGAFFRADIFYEIFFPLLGFRSLQEMADVDPVYPIEEFTFSLCTETFCKRHRVRRCSHLVATAKGPKQQATIEEIDATAASGNKWAIKRFLPNQDAPERLHVRSIIGLGGGKARVPPAPGGAPPP